MENLQMIEQSLKLLGIDDNMIVTETMNISGSFIVEGGHLKILDRIKIIVDFEVDMMQKNKEKRDG